MFSSRLTPTLSFLLAVLAVNSGVLCSGAENFTQIRESLKPVDICFIQTVYSFLYPQSYLPTNTNGLSNACKTQAEGVKCVKDISKKIPSALMRRALAGVAQSRQRYNKKYCTNVNSEASKQLVKDFKCVMDKKFDAMKRVDIRYANEVSEILRKNHNDSSIELKELCCAVLKYRKGIVDNTQPECASSKGKIEEMINSVVSDEIFLLCDDEEKMLTKICPLLKLNVSETTYNFKPGSGPSITSLYIIATLGEPEV